MTELAPHDLPNVSEIFSNSKAAASLARILTPGVHATYSPGNFHRCG